MMWKKKRDIDMMYSTDTWILESIFLIDAISSVAYSQ